MRGLRASPSEPPHPNPLPSGERECARVSRSILTAAFLLLFVYSTSPVFADAAFQSWLQSLWPQAPGSSVYRARHSIARRAGSEPDLSLPDLVLPGRPEKPQAGQAEFVQTPADYLQGAGDRAASPPRGAGSTPSTAPSLAGDPAKQFGVDLRETWLPAIFGRESDFGRARCDSEERHPRAGDAGLSSASARRKFLEEICAGAENPRRGPGQARRHEREFLGRRHGAHRNSCRRII